MNLTINGERKELQGPSTLIQVLSALGLATVGVAISVNGEVVPRSEQETKKIQSGDVIEVVRAVGGG